MSAELLRSLDKIARRLRRAATSLDDEDALRRAFERVDEAAQEAGEAWSGSCLGYHSRVYMRGFRPKKSGEYFTAEWGLLLGGQYSPGQWIEYENRAVIAKILDAANVTPKIAGRLDEAGASIEQEFEESKNEALPILRAMGGDKNIDDIAASVAALTHGPGATELAKSKLPTSGQSRAAVRLPKGGSCLPISSWTASSARSTPASPAARNSPSTSNTRQTTCERRERSSRSRLLLRLGLRLPRRTAPPNRTSCSSAMVVRPCGETSETCWNGT